MFRVCRPGLDPGPAKRLPTLALVFASLGCTPACSPSSPEGNSNVESGSGGVWTTGGSEGETGETGGSAGSEYCLDEDGDGYGNPSECQPGPDLTRVENGDDCDDASAETFPGAAELESTIDCMRDEDQDGYGSHEPPSGVLAGSDCEDENPVVLICSTWCQDADADGAGDPMQCVEASVDAPPGGTVDNGDDCDDTNPNVIACEASCGVIGPNLTCSADMETLTTVQALEACVASDLPMGVNAGFSAGYFSVWDAEGFSGLGYVDEVLDHSTGLPNGRIALLDSSGTLDEVLFGTTLAVEPNTPYLFTAWMRNANAGTPPVVTLSINGEDLIPANSEIAYVQDPGVWQEVSVRWDSGAASEAELQILNRQGTSEDNDLLLDDVLFRTCEGFVTP